MSLLWWDSLPNDTNLQSKCFKKSWTSTEDICALISTVSPMCHFSNVVRLGFFFLTRRVLNQKGRSLNDCWSYVPIKHKKKSRLVQSLLCFLFVTEKMFSYLISLCYRVKDVVPVIRPRKMKKTKNLGAESQLWSAWWSLKVITNRMLFEFHYGTMHSTVTSGRAQTAVKCHPVSGFPEPSQT